MSERARFQQVEPVRLYQRIVEQIEAGGHDLLAMGSRGRGRLTSNLFGSVGSYVHLHSRVAMLVINPDG